MSFKMMSNMPGCNIMLKEMICVPKIRLLGVYTILLGIY